MKKQPNYSLPNANPAEPWFPYSDYLVTATAKQIQERVKKHQINYGKSIIALSYRRAFKVFHFYKGVFAHEIIQ